MAEKYTNLTETKLSNGQDMLTQEIVYSKTLAKALFFLFDLQ